jgi:hypothetical protein
MAVFKCIWCGTSLGACVRVRLERPFRFALAFLAVALALTAVLLAGCGGGDDRAKVEASLQRYIGGLFPEDSPFPSGAGIPRVKDNGCKDQHRKFEWREFPVPGWSAFFKGKKFALWSCVVRFGTLTMTVVVAVDDRTEVVWASPGSKKMFS